jgi:hypothetical protein
MPQEMLDKLPLPCLIALLRGAINTTKLQAKSPPTTNRVSLFA